MNDINTVNSEEEIEKTPHQLWQERMDISNIYIEKWKRMAELKKIKAVWWHAMRPDFKSDTSTERAWDLTEEGQDMMSLQIEMKWLEMKMSAIKTMLQVLEVESRNQW